MPALRMNSGVGSSGSPTQNASTSATPSAELTTSRILEAASERTAGRASSMAVSLTFRVTCTPHGFVRQAGSVARRGARDDGGLGLQLRGHQIHPRADGRG